MRSKEQISDEFKRIQRALITKDFPLTNTEALVQSWQIIAELIVDLRTCLTRIAIIQDGKEAKDDNNTYSMKDVTP